jgi:PLP dependent protein
MAIVPPHKILTPQWYEKFTSHQLLVVAVCKKQPDEKIKEAVEAGYTHFGENTLSGLARTTHLLAPLKAKTFLHYIGRLQSNKIKKICELSPYMIHSAAQNSHLNTFLKFKKSGVRIPKLLLQINTTLNKNQEGIPPNEHDLKKVLSDFSKISLEGLMTMGPNPEGWHNSKSWELASKQSFHALYALKETLVKAGFSELKHLSMGMSGDYKIALTEGATILRIGTRIFGPRFPV